MLCDKHADDSASSNLPLVLSQVSAPTGLFVILYLISKLLEFLGRRRGAFTDLGGGSCTLSHR